LITERRPNSIGIPSDRRGTLSLVHAGHLYTLQSPFFSEYSLVAVLVAENGDYIVAENDDYGRRK